MSWSTSRSRSSTAVDAIVPVRPGRVPLTVTQDRLAERRFVGGGRRRGRTVARGPDDRRAARSGQRHSACRSDSSRRRGGYDGRSQLRLATIDELDGALERLGRPAGEPFLAEAEMAFAAGGVDHRHPQRRWPARGRTRSRRTCTTTGSSPRAWRPAPVPDDVATRAAALGERLALAMGLTGTLTAELFLMPDGRLVVERARAARPQQRPLDARWRGDLAVRAAHPGDLRPGPRGHGRPGPDGDGQPVGRGPATRCAARSRCPFVGRCPTRPSTSICTTSGASSNAARWAT